MEIERKFLMDGFPEGLPLLYSARVEQAYLCTRPTVRVRHKDGEHGESFVLCFKGRGTLEREEIELELAPGVYQRLLALCAMPGIRKDYRVYALPGGLQLECSLVDEGEPMAFWYAEVEFESAAEANAFVPPPFLGRDVTEEPGHSMAAYWERKLAGGEEKSSRAK